MSASACPVWLQKWCDREISRMQRHPLLTVKWFLLVSMALAHTQPFYFYRWTLWCKERLTEADTPTIRLGATPSRLSSAHLHHPPFFTGRGCPSCCPTNSVKALKATSAWLWGSMKLRLLSAFTHPAYFCEVTQVRPAYQRSTTRGNLGELLQWDFLQTICSPVSQPPQGWWDKLRKKS